MPVISAASVEDAEKLLSLFTMLVSARIRAEVSECLRQPFDNKMLILTENDNWRERKFITATKFSDT